MREPADRASRRSMMENSPSRMQLAVVAGLLFFVAGAVLLMGIITAEALYPGYSTSQHAISDLGASEPPNSVIVQPSATIFNTTMMVAGLLILAGAFFVFRSFRIRGFPVLLALLGTGALGVGIFPGNFGDLHAIMALMTFVAGGLSAIAAFTVTRPPFRYVSVVLGMIGLLPLILFYIMGTSNPFWVLGYGGLERWIAYPIVLWVTGFGGYLMGIPASGTVES